MVGADRPQLLLAPGLVVLSGSQSSSLRSRISTHWVVSSQYARSSGMSTCSWSSGRIGRLNFQAIATSLRTLSEANAAAEQHRTKAALFWMAVTIPARSSPRPGCRSGRSTPDTGPVQARGYRRDHVMVIAGVADEDMAACIGHGRLLRRARDTYCHHGDGATARQLARHGRAFRAWKLPAILRFVVHARSTQRRGSGKGLIDVIANGRQSNRDTTLRRSDSR